MNISFRHTLIQLCGLLIFLTSGCGQISSSLRDAVELVKEPKPSLSLESPAMGFASKQGVTLVGGCKQGLDIQFSGSGLLSSITVPCASGSFSQFVYFSNGDGAKEVSIAQVDSSAVILTVTRTFVNDMTAPAITQNLRTSPYYTTSDAVIFGGSCEEGLSVVVSNTDTATVPCLLGAWTYATSAKTTDASRPYTFSQTDAAGNIGSVTATWIRDTLPPALSFSSASNFITSSNAVTFSGNCEFGSSIAISGDAASAIACSGGLWSYTANASTDANRTYNFTQVDAAGNSTTITGTWQRNTVGPTIVITQSTPQISTGNALTISGTCGAGGSSIQSFEVSGAVSPTPVTCSSGAFSYNASQAVDGNHVYNFTIKDVLGNSSLATLVWTRDTTAPVLSAGTFKMNGLTNGTTAVSYNPIQFSITDNLSKVTKFCLKNSNSAPLASDSCWTPVNGPQTNVTPANSISISGFYYNLGIIPQVYNIYLWAMDGAGNISANTAVSGTDVITMDYSPIPPPSVSTVLVGKSDLMNGDPNDRLIPGGGTVYIRWTASGSSLSATPVQLFFTTDDINWTALSGNLTNGNNNCGTTTGTGSSSSSATGCYVWTSGSPTNSYYRIRVAVTNTLGATTFANSLPVNASTLQVLAGNTEPGIMGAATSSIFQSNYQYSFQGDIQNLVVDTKGTIYFRDINFGIMYINPTDGKVRQLIPLGATTSGKGDGGSVTLASLRMPTALALDAQDRLLILDYDRIRRVDFSSSPATISTLIGGGSNSGDAVPAPATSLFIQPITFLVEGDYLAPLHVLPNGDIYFYSDNYRAYSGKRIRVYHADTGNVTSIKLNGSATAASGRTYSSFDACGITYFGMRFEPATSNILNFISSVRVGSMTPACMTVPAGLWYGDLFQFNTTTGTVDTSLTPAFPPTDPNDSSFFFPVQAQDGNIYTVSRLRGYISKYDPMTNTWAHLVGTGAKGSCDDGTPALSCSIDPGGTFVDAAGRVYFADRGRIRTIINGNIRTIAGQAFNFGDGGLATNARFGSLSSVQMKSDASVVALDVTTARLRSFPRNGNILSLAGNDKIASTPHGADPLLSPLLTQNGWQVRGTFAIDTSDKIYFGDGMVSLANTAGATWQKPWFGGGTAYYSAGAHGTSAVNISQGNHMFYVLGYNGTSVLYQTSSFVSGNPENLVYGEVNSVTGINSINLNSATFSANTCADGTPLSSCVTHDPSPGNTPMAASYDSGANQWQLIDSDLRTVRRFNSGGTGTMETATQFGNVAKSFVFQRFGGTRYFYYCAATGPNAGRMYLRNADMNTEMVLPWPIPSISCTGTQFIYDQAKHSLVFPYVQNGLYGVAELLNVDPALNGM